MERKRVLESLCYYDPRNPDFDIENGERKKDCYCDNCFRGKTELAEYILKLLNHEQ